MNIKSASIPNSDKLINVDDNNTSMAILKLFARVGNSVLLSSVPTERMNLINLAGAVLTFSKKFFISFT